MKEKFELIGSDETAHLIRKFKKHWWSKWTIEMDGNTPKIYLVDQENCEHDYKFVEIFKAYPNGAPWRLFRCSKCGVTRAKPLL